MTSSMEPLENLAFITLSPQASVTGFVVSLPLVDNIPGAKYVSVMITHIPPDQFLPRTFRTSAVKSTHLSYAIGKELSV